LITGSYSVGPGVARCLAAMVTRGRLPGRRPRTGQAAAHSANTSRNGRERGPVLCYSRWVNITELVIFHRSGGSSPPSDTSNVALTCGYPFLGMGQVNNVAGRSHGGSSPSRTRAYVHAETSTRCPNLPGVSGGCLRASRREGKQRVPGQGCPSAERQRFVRRSRPDGSVAGMQIVQFWTAGMQGQIVKGPAPAPTLEPLAYHGAPPASRPQDGVRHPVPALRSGGDPTANRRGRLSAELALDPALQRGAALDAHDDRIPRLRPGAVAAVVQRL
jgi:hypothetical protein